MFYRIRDGLKFCNTGEEFIFLDAGAGRYFSLPHPTHGAFATLIGERGPLSPEVSRDLRVLIDRGYLIADERRFQVASLAARQLTDSIKPDIYLIPAVRLLASALSWQIFFAVLLRALPLGSVLSKLPQCHPGSVALPFDVLEAVAAFKKAAWLFGERSEARRVGKECVSTCRSRWSPYP